MPRTAEKWGFTEQVALSWPLNHDGVALARQWHDVVSFKHQNRFVVALKPHHTKILYPREQRTEESR